MTSNDTNLREILTTMIGGEEQYTTMFSDMDALERGAHTLTELLQQVPGSSIGSENFHSLFITTAADMRIILLMIARCLLAMREYNTEAPSSPTIV